MADPVTTFKWIINELERKLSNGAVTTVHYSIDASDGTYQSGAYGSTALDQPESDSDLTPYADLTEDWAISATKAKLTKDNGDTYITQLEQTLQSHLDEQRTPTMGKGKPWT